MAALRELFETRKQARRALADKCAKVRSDAETRGHDLHPWGFGNQGLTAATACRKCGATATIIVTASRLTVDASQLDGRCQSWQWDDVDTLDDWSAQT